MSDKMIDIPIQTQLISGGRWAGFGELTVNGDVVIRDNAKHGRECETYMIFMVKRTEREARERAEREIPFVFAMARRDGKIQ